MGLTEASGAIVRVFRVFRLVRVLRPLRLIKRLKVYICSLAFCRDVNARHDGSSQNLRVIVNALVGSVKAVTYVILLVLALFFVFSIMGLNLFRGKLYYCNDGTRAGKEDCTGAFWYSFSPSQFNGLEDATSTIIPVNNGAIMAEEVPFPSAILVPRVWDRPWWHMDDILNAFLTLFEVRIVP